MVLFLFEVNMDFEKFQLDENWSVDYANQLKSLYGKVWNDSLYEQFEVKVEKNDIVVDCGAGIGVFSNYAASKGAKKVLAFEASQKHFDCLKKNTEKTKGVTSVFGLVNHRAVAVNGESISEEQYDLERIYKDFKLKKIDFLRTDLEACEFGLLLNCSDEDITKINKLAVEIHICGILKDKVLEYHFFVKIIERLNKLGFLTFIVQNVENSGLFTLFAKKNK